MLCKIYKKRLAPEAMPLELSNFFIKRDLSLFIKKLLSEL
jgi:hypothetical protein